jgi:nucleoside-diphosphate-sugar epimerase
MNHIILVAGATGDLGQRIVRELVRKNVEVRALVRPTSDAEKINAIEKTGAKIFRIKDWNHQELSTACEGVSCVVSALAGLREVVIDAQKILLDASIKAGVPRFIPSDYSLDFTKFSDGENRNLDWRREFHSYLDKSTISPTSIFNGAFAELLTGQMPVIFFKQKLVVHWGDADKKWDFTTMDNTAEYTANAAVDASTPRYLRIAGDQISPREIRDQVSELTGQKFRLIKTGGSGLLKLIIRIAKKIAPSPGDLYPAWQGMQYMHNMIDQRSFVGKLDNDRYQGINWTKVKEILKQQPDLFQKKD